MAKTNTGLVNYAKAQLGKPYWYGTFGDIATEALYKSKKNQYPKRYKRANYNQGWEHQYGQRVHDCVGLIKGYLWSENATAKPKYNSAQDVSANGMLKKCKEKGKIATIPEIAGVLVFFDGHVGVYIGGGYVIEARGHDYGVVKTKLSARPWTDWGKCPWIEYSATASSTTTTKKSVTEIAHEVIAGKWGTGATRKEKLTEAGYNYNEVQAKVNEILKSDSPKVTYFKQYTGKSVSLVDSLEAIGVDSSRSYRKKIATANGIKVYLGSSDQNTKLLLKLKMGVLIKP